MLYRFAFSLEGDNGGKKITSPAASPGGGDVQSGRRHGLKQDGKQR